MPPPPSLKIVVGWPGGRRWLLPGTWSHLWFAGVRECPPWCSIVGATVTVHQFFCILLGYCFTPYQRLWIYNGAPLVAFYDTLGIRRTYSRLKPRRPHGGPSLKKEFESSFKFYVTCNDISVIYVTARGPISCTFGRAPNARHFAGFFNVPVHPREGPGG